MGRKINATEGIDLDQAAEVIGKSIIEGAKIIAEALRGRSVVDLAEIKVKKRKHESDGEGQHISSRSSTSWESGEDEIPPLDDLPPLEGFGEPDR